MKKNLLMLLLLCPFFGHSQQLSLIDTTYTWNIGVMSFGIPVQTVFMKISGDTAYSGNQYYKFYSSDDSLFSVMYLDGLVREDTAAGIVWYKDLHNPCGPEEEIYIDTLDEGESHMGYTCAPLSFMVDSSSYIFLDGKLRKVMIFNLNGGANPREYWVEGFGSTFSPVKPHHNFCVADLEYHVLCIHRNSTLVWSNPLFTECYWPDVSALGEVQDEENIRVYPNPSADDLRITGAEELSEICLLNLQGALIRSWSGPLSPPLTLEAGEIPGGTYLLVIKTVSGHIISRKVVR